MKVGGGEEESDNRLEIDGRAQTKWKYIYGRPSITENDATIRRKMHAASQKWIA